MMRKVLSVSLCAFTLLVTSLPVYAEETEVESAEYIAEQLGGEVITEDELPDGVVPIEFDTVEEAQEFIDEVNEDLDKITLSDPDVSEPIRKGLQKRAAANTTTITKSASWDITGGLGTQKLNIYVNCKVKNNVFTEVSSVSSSLTGFTLGAGEWHQDSYSYSITNAGKMLNVTTYGHFDYYILINTKYTKVASEKRNFSNSWAY